MEQFSLEKYLENPQRKVVTRCGKEARIICTDRRSIAGYNIGALLDNGSTEEFVTYTANGKFNNGYDDYDLFFTPHKQSRWVYLYKVEDEAVGEDYYGIQRSGLFNSKKEAEKCMGKDNGFALTEITWEE